jgi:hypothetical protein
VRVTFTELAEQTQGRLEHSGWEVFDDPAAAPAEHDQGWLATLDCYGDDVATVVAAGDPVAETWVALLHRPGPTAPRGHDLR